MTEEFCKAKGAMCDPKDCNRELCWWRDTVWAIRQMASWAYSDMKTGERTPDRSDSKPRRSRKRQTRWE